MISAAFGTVWVFCGKLVYPVPSQFTKPLPTNTEGCSAGFYPMNATTSDLLYNSSVSQTNFTLATSTSTMIEQRPPVADLYAISYIYLTAFGFCIGMVVGLVVSLLTGKLILILWGIVAQNRRVIS